MRLRVDWLLEEATRLEVSKLRRVQGRTSTYRDELSKGIVVRKSRKGIKLGPLLNNLDQSCNGTLSVFSAARSLSERLTFKISRPDSRVRIETHLRETCVRRLDVG